MNTDWLKQLPLATLLRVSALAVILSLNAAAHGGGHGGGGGNGGGGHGGGGGNHGAPEIDPTLAGAGIVLLAGGTLVLIGRRRAATC